MKQSKLLKKSLAALLAILMVAAMIPMSAFAADADTISVNGVEAKLGENGYSVALSYPSDTVSAKLTGLALQLSSMTGTTVGVFGKNGQQVCSTLHGIPSSSSSKATINLKTWAVEKPETGDFGTYTLELRVKKAGDEEATTYPLTVTVSQRAKSGSTELAEVKSSTDKIVDYKIDNTARTITIVKAIGTPSTDSALGLSAASFVKADKNATGADYIELTTSAGKTTVVTVKAENNSTAKYSVKYEVEPIFDSFTFPGMTSVETKESADTGCIIMTAKVPFGTDLKEVIPTFTANANVERIVFDAHANASFNSTAIQTPQDAYQNDDTAQKDSSGVAAYDLSAAKYFTVTTDKSADYSSSSLNNVKLVVEVAPNPANQLTGVQVGTQNIQTVSSTNTDVVVNGAAVPGSTSIKLYVSEGATVTLVKPDGTELAKQTDNGEDGASGENGNDDSAVNGIIPFTVTLSDYTTNNLQVVVQSAATGNGATYNLKFKASGTDKTNLKINSFSLIKDDKTYTAVPSTEKDGVWVIELPYEEAKAAPPATLDNTTATVPGAAAAPSFLANFKVSVDATDGAIVNTLSSSYTANDFDVAGTIPKALIVGTDHTSAVTIVNGSTGANTLFFDPWLQYMDKKTDSTHPGAKYSGDCYGGFVLHAHFDTPASDGSECNNKCVSQVVILKRKTASAQNTLYNIKLTSASKIADINENNTFTGIVDVDKKIVRIDVPFDYAVNTKWNSGKLYVLDALLSDGATLANSSDDAVKVLNPASLADQDSTAGALVTMDAKAIHYTADTFEPDDNNAESTYLTFKTVAENGTAKESYKIYAVKAPSSSECNLNGISSETAGVSAAFDTTLPGSNLIVITVPHSYNAATYNKDTAKTFDLKFDISSNATLKNGNNVWAGPNVKAEKFTVVNGKLYYGSSPVTVNTMTVIAENETSTKEYTFKIEMAEVQTDATIASIKVGETEATAEEAAYTAVIADDTADLTKQILTIETTSPVAKVQIDGKDFDKTKTYDVSKEVKITVTAEDGTTKNEYTLIATIKPKSNDATLTGVSVDGVAATIAEEAITAEAEDPASVTLELTLPEGATAKVGETEYTAGMTVDATEAVTIVVTAEDGTEKTYTLTVSKKSSEPTPSPSPKPGLDDVNDVEANDWFAQYVANVLERGIMSADSKGNFRPGEKVTRSQFAVMMCNLNGVNPDEYANAENPYTDVKKDGWDFKWIMAAVANDWMSGTSSTTFEPGSYVTREQTALIIAKSQGLSKVTEPKELYSDDAQIASWAKGWVYACKEAGLMGYMSQSQKTFAPKGDLTRAQMATILSGIEAPSTPENPDDGNNPENPDEGNNPENPDEGNNPENPDEGNNPENPDEGNNPENPDEGNNPENPDEGNNPENPDEGNTPETPDEGSNPETPDEGSTGGDNTTGGETVAE